MSTAKFFRIRFDSMPQIVESSSQYLKLVVPAAWTDADILWFAEDEEACPTVNGWQIRRDESYRRPCRLHDGLVSVFVDAPIAVRIVE